jgi:hypothetical protein
MATVTPNFNWPVPTSTDLVKDGATAIEALGDSIDGSLVDLKGGTTGQVLSKTSGTDMDFTWVTTDDANAIQNSIVDAKGDLIAASANDTPARLAVGNNGETLVADSSATTGLRYTGANQQNPILNSSFDIWQRGTSISVPASTTSQYTTDRWVLSTQANQASTVSRQSTSDTTNLPFIQYCARVQRNSGQTGAAYQDFYYGFDTASAIPLAGKTITLSFYARKGANYSATSSLLKVRVYTGTGTDQNFATGYTGNAEAWNTDVTLTTTWQRFTTTVAIGATVTEFATVFTNITTGTASTNDYYEITGVQYDIGSVALPYRRNSATIQGELAACQRYYYRITPDASLRQYGSGMAYSTTSAVITIPYPVTMRTRPTAVEQSGTASDYSTLRNTTATDNLTSVLIFYSVTSNTQGAILTTSNNLVAGQATALYNNNTNGYIGWSAEL